MAAFCVAAEPKIILAQFPANSPREIVEQKSVTAKFTETPPVIDGKDTEKCWKNAEAAKDFYSTNGIMTAADVKTEAKLLYDKKYLYVFFNCDEPFPEKIKAAITQHDGPVWSDDSVELFIAANPASGEYVHFIINTKGSIFDEKGKDLLHANNTGDPRGKNWNSTINAACGKTEKGWTAEFSILLDELSPDQTLSEWRINLTRSRSAGKVPEWSSWNYIAGGFHQPLKFGILKIKESPLDVKYNFQESLLTGPDHILMKTTNNSDKNLQIDSILTSLGKEEKFSSQQKLNLRSHATEYIQLPIEIYQQEDHIINIMITDSADKKILYKSSNIATTPELIKANTSGNLISSDGNFIYNFKINATPEFLKTVTIDVRLFAEQNKNAPVISKKFTGISHKEASIVLYPKGLKEGKYIFVIDISGNTGSLFHDKYTASIITP